MESHKTASVSRTYVPNEYTVYLSRDDRRQFEGYEQALLDELSAHLLEHAARENLALLTRPKVSFETDKRLRMGEFGIQARLVKPARRARRRRPRATSARRWSTRRRASRKQAEREPGVAEKPVSRALLVADGKSFVIDRPRAVDRPQPALRLRAGGPERVPPALRAPAARAATGTWSTSTPPTASRVNGRRVTVEPARPRATRSWPGRRASGSTSTEIPRVPMNDPVAVLLQVRLHRGPLPVPALGRSQRAQGPARGRPVPAAPDERAAGRSSRAARCWSRSAAEACAPDLRLPSTAASTIGRSPQSEIQIDDPFASARHARIFERDGFYYVEDMGSTNGTYLNGQAASLAGAAASRGQDPDRRYRVPVRAVIVAMETRAEDRRGGGADRHRPPARRERGRLLRALTGLRGRGRDGRRAGR